MVLLNLHVSVQRECIGTFNLKGNSFGLKNSLNSFEYLDMGGLIEITYMHMGLSFFMSKFI